MRGKTAEQTELPSGLTCQLRSATGIEDGDRKRPIAVQADSDVEPGIFSGEITLKSTDGGKFLIKISGAVQGQTFSLK